MDSSRHQPYVVIQNGYPPVQHASHGQPRRPDPTRSTNGANGRPNILRRSLRAPTVDEALPFSPFTSIVPFSPEILPLLSPAPIASTIDLTPGDRKAAREHLELLNAEANNPRQTSQLLDQSLRQLQHLLRPAEVTQYKFQSLPFDSKSSSGSSSANSSTPTRLPNLSPFAKLVMDSTDVSYRYPTPTSPSNEPSRRTIKAEEIGGYARQTARPKVQDKVEAECSHKPNTVNQLQVEKQPVTVVQPVVLQSPRLLDHQKLHEVDPHGASEQANQSGKRNRETVDNQATLTLDIDQREQVNVALNAFSHLLASTFEAEDDYEPESRCSSDYFLPDVAGSKNSPFLSKLAVNRLDSAIQKVTSVRGLAEVTLENLSRLQKLLSYTVNGVDTFNLVLSQDNNESDVDEWLQRVDMAEIGLLAARILLRIMTAGREEKQLYSEDYLNCIVCALEHVIDTCIIPIVESRSSTDKDNFRTFSAQKKPLTSLLLTVGKVLRLFGNLIAKVDIADSAVAKVEYIATRLIFVENAPVEKESCLGIQRFEVLRRTAMDVLAQIFQRYPDQRTSIIDEILVSLEKLPVTRQSARQFKLPDGKPIQLVSALLMRLVQASSSMSLDSKSERRQDQLEDDDDADMSDAEAPHPRRRMSTVSAEDGEHSDESNQNVRKLRERVTPLYDSASKNASYMVQFLVQRALKSTKSGDTPYRNLLDIFTEDFLNVLGMPEWPAAEMLLRALLSKMIFITNDEKSSVPSKNVALDLLGLMGSGISDLLLLLQNSSKSLDASQSDLANRLTQLLNSEDKINDSELIHFKGPYRIVIEYLYPHSAKDPHIYSAVTYLVTQWAKNTLAVADNDGSFPVSKELLHSLRKVLMDYDWLRSEYSFDPVSPFQAKLASALIASNLPFCKFQAQILQRLLVFMTSPHATLMNRSLKSVNQLIDKDPSIVERSDDVLKQILFCTDAGSSLVRDSALSLLAKCLIHRPSLEKQVYRRVMARVVDEAIIVRKRAMKTLKDIYLRNNTDDMRTDIASVLLTRMKDPDEGVSDLARQIFEELWMVPYHESSKKDGIHQQLALQKHVSLFVRTVRAGAFPLAELENFLQRILSNDSRNAAANYKVCKNMVAAMMDAIVDNEERSDKPSQHQLAESLTVFANVQPKLFTSDQVKLLAAYLRNISNENLPMFRVVVVIYRHVLPVLSSSVDQDFLGVVLTDLMGSLTRLQKSELQLTADCLWIITGILEKRDRLVRLMLSALSNIQSRENLNFTQVGQEKAADQVRRFIHLTGAFGSACDFDSLADEFRAKFTNWHGIEVCNLIIDIIYPFTQPKQPKKIREASIESVATICQAWPQLYLRTDVSKAFELVFLNDEEGLEGIVLKGFQQFFAKAEKRSETGADIKVGDGAVHGQERLATSYTATDQDGAAAAISQKLLPQFIRVALEKGNELALCATQVIASVYRQGLVHPKICVPAFVALETSSYQQIASIAFEEHRRLHHAHETMIEKEYIDAIRQAYKFQRDVVKDPRGFTLRKHDDKQHSEAKQSNYIPKLRSPFTVMNTGSAKVRKRFLANLCKELDFELPELDTTQEHPEHITYTCFILENLALFDYERVDDIVVVAEALQKLVTEGVGVSVAQAIEEEILNIRLDLTEYQQAFQVEQPIVSIAIQNGDDPRRLRQLTVASMILTMAWETRTFLRQLWGLQKKLGQKPSTKDVKKGGVTRAPGFHSDKLFEGMSAILRALESQENQRQQCRTFVEIVNIDREHRAASEEDCIEAELVVKVDGYETPVEDGESIGSNPPSTTGKGKKRKSSVSLNTPVSKRRKIGVPKRNKPNGKQKGRTGSKSNTDDDDDVWD